VKGTVVVLRYLNLRHFRRRRLRTALTAAGIAAGVALVFSISVINGTLLASARESIRDLAGDAEIEVASADATGLSEAAIADVRSVEGVEDAIPVLRVSTEVTGTDGNVRLLVIGVTPSFRDLFRGDEDAADLRVEGGAGSGADGLILAEATAGRIDAPIGTIVAAVAPSGPAALTVTGTVEGGRISSLNGGAIGVMYLPAAQEAFERPGRVDSIYVVVAPDADLTAVAGDIERRLGGGAIVGPPGTRGRGFDETFGALSTLTSLAGIVALFVAMFVVYNTMSMSLAERRREISMVQAFGATRRHVAGAFLAEAGLIGVLASTMGLVLGGALAQILVGPAATQYSILPLTSVGSIAVTPAQIVIAGVGGVVVAILGALLPALSVFRVAPVESLRPEANYEWSSARSRRVRAARLPVAAGTLVLALVLLGLFARTPQVKPLAIAGLLAGLIGVTLALPALVPRVGTLLQPLVVRSFGTLGRIASDALLKNPGRTTYTVGALVLTLGMVVSVGAALGSYEDEVETQAESSFATPLFVGSSSFTGLGSDQPLDADLERGIESVDGVESAFPQRYVSVDIEGQQALLYAVPTLEAQAAGSGERFVGASENEERLVDGLVDGGIVISRLTAKRHGLATGASLEIPTPSGAHSFPVVGVFPDLASFDSMFIDHATYLRFWKDDKVDRYAVVVEPGADVGATADRLKDLIAQTGAPADVLTKRELIDTILSAIRGLFSIARGIQIAALLIAILTIANTMFTGVLERRWESGLSRALGMSAAQLRASILLEAGLIGLLGSLGAVLLGLVLGFVMTQIMEAQFSWSVSFHVPWLLSLLAIVTGASVSVIAGSLPSRSATRIPIIEALRYE
jgi:putative ABC transport system permease protein